MTDFSKYVDSLESPARSIKAVTPNDAVDLPDGVCKALLVTADGNVVLIAESDPDIGAVTVATLKGAIIPVRVRRVKTGTTATVLALY
jgi:hypothetical protein